MAAAARSLLQRGAVAGGMFAATRTISTISSWKAQYLLNSNAVAIATTTTCMRPWAVTLGFRSARLLGAASIAHFPRLAVQARGFSSVKSESSLNDPSPNWSNRPPKETILLDGCDFEHWLIVMEPPQGDPTRDEIIDSYIKTLAQIVGSEEEARMKIYSVSTRHYYAFGCLISEELSYKLKPLPNVRWVLPDSYLDPRTKDYGGEPFINGQAVPYDPKYHEEWVRNNAKCNESRSRDRPRNFDRSRNFERRREMQQQARQNYQRPPPSQPGYPGPPPPSQPGFSNQPPSQPGFSNQPPTQPGFSNQPPSQPGFSNQPPSQPGYPAPPPPSQPGFPNQPPSQPGYQSTPSPQSGYGNPPSHSGYSNPPHNPSAYGNPPPSQPGYSSPTGNPSGYYDYQGQQR